MHGGTFCFVHHKLDSKPSLILYELPRDHLKWHSRSVCIFPGLRNGSCGYRAWGVSLASSQNNFSHSCQFVNGVPMVNDLRCNVCYKLDDGSSSSMRNRLLSLTRSIPGLKCSFLPRKWDTTEAQLGSWPFVVKHLPDSLTRAGAKINQTLIIPR